MIKFNANDKVKFEIRTTRKQESFHLSWDGQLTITEPTTAQEVKDSLLVEFLSEVNKPRHEQLKYRPNEVKITLALA
jgi:hypothetical protein